jgi:hypothetical protein
MGTYLWNRNRIEEIFFKKSVSFSNQSQSDIYRIILFSVYTFLALLMLLLTIFQLVPIPVNTRYIITGATILFGIAGEIVIATALTINGCIIYARMNPDRSKFIKMKVSFIGGIGWWVVYAFYDHFGYLLCDRLCD